MKNQSIFWLLLSLMVASQVALGQAFTFDLYFEDAIGQKDTLTIGYDLEATPLLPGGFGMEDIKGIPLTDSFEARATFLDYNASFLAFAEGDCRISNDFTPYHSKLLITYPAWEQMAAAVFFVNPVLPLTIRWDNALFQGSGLGQAVITGWVPGGWFDAPLCFLMDFDNISLLDNNEVVVSTLEGYPLAAKIAIGDRLASVLFIGFGLMSHTAAESAARFVRVHPNPASEAVHFSFTLPDLAQPARLAITDGQGRALAQYAHLRANEQVVLPTGDLAPGLYFYRLTLGSGEFAAGRFVVR